jgi:hypothetical protein
MFLVRCTNEGETRVLTLSPGPTEVEYPERFHFTSRSTQDGAVVIQRPPLDERPRRWVWKGYRPWQTDYELQWKELESLETRTRSLAGNSPIVEIWEGETDQGGFGALTSGAEPDFETFSNLRWTRVRFVQVSRTTRKGGGSVVYEDSVVEFRIADPAYQAF